MAVKTSAIKKVSREEMFAAQGKVREQLEDNWKKADADYQDAKKEYEKIKTTHPKESWYSYENKMNDLFKVKEEHKKKLDSIPKQDKNSIIGQGTVGLHPIDNDESAENLRRRSDGTYTFDQRSELAENPGFEPNKQIIGWKNGKPIYYGLQGSKDSAAEKVSGELKQETSKVDQPKDTAGVKTGFQTFLDDEARNAIAQREGKDPKKISDKDIEDYHRAMRASMNDYDTAARKRFDVNNKTRNMAIAELQRQGKKPEDITEFAINQLISDNNYALQKQAEIELEEEENYKKQFHPKDMQTGMAYSTGDKAAQIAQLKKDFTEELMKRYPEYNRAQAEKLTEKIYSANPEKFEDKLNKTRAMSEADNSIQSGMSMLTEDQQNKKFNSLGEAQHFIKTMYTGISDEDAKKIAEKAFKNGATPKLVMASMGGWKAHKDAEAAKKEEAELKLRQAMRRAHWSAVGSTLAFFGGGLARAIPSALDVHLRTTHKLLTSFMSANPMSMASQTVAVVASGIGEGYKVLKDFDKTYGIDDENHPYHQSWSKGVFKIKRYQEERQKGLIELNAIDERLNKILKKYGGDFNNLDEDTALEVYNQFLGEIHPEYTQLHNMAERDKRRAAHHQPGLMTESQRMKYKALSAMKKNIASNITMLNKIDKLSRRKNIVAEMDAIKGKNSLTSLPENITTDNLIEAEKTYAENDAKIQNIIVPEKKRLEGMGNRTGAQQRRLSALKYIVKDHAADAAKISPIRELQDENIKREVYDDLFDGLSSEDVSHLNGGDLETLKKRFIKYDKELRDLRGQTYRTNDQESKYRVLDNLYKIIIKNDSDRSEMEQAQFKREKQEEFNTHITEMGAKVIPLDEYKDNFLIIPPNGQFDEKYTDALYELLANDANSDDIHNIKLNKAMVIEGGYKMPSRDERERFSSRLNKYKDYLSTKEMHDRLVNSGQMTEDQYRSLITYLEKYNNAVINTNTNTNKKLQSFSNTNLYASDMYRLPENEIDLLNSGHEFWLRGPYQSEGSYIRLMLDASYKLNSELSNLDKDSDEYKKKYRIKCSLVASLQDMIISDYFKKYKEDMGGSTDPNSQKEIEDMRKRAEELMLPYSENITDDDIARIENDGHKQEVYEYITKLEIKRQKIMENRPGARSERAEFNREYKSLMHALSLSQTRGKTEEAVDYAYGSNPAFYYHREPFMEKQLPQPTKDSVEADETFEKRKRDMHIEIAKAEDVFFKDGWFSTNHLSGDDFIDMLSDIVTMNPTQRRTIEDKISNFITKRNDAAPRIISILKDRYGINDITLEAIISDVCRDKKPYLNDNQREVVDEIDGRYKRITGKDISGDIINKMTMVVGIYNDEKIPKGVVEDTREMISGIAGSIRNRVNDVYAVDLLGDKNFRNDLRKSFNSYFSNCGDIRGINNMSKEDFVNMIDTNLHQYGLDLDELEYISTLDKDLFDDYLNHNPGSDINIWSAMNELKPEQHINDKEEMARYNKILLKRDKILANIQYRSKIPTEIDMDDLFKFTKISNYKTGKYVALTKKYSDIDDVLNYSDFDEKDADDMGELYENILKGSGNDDFKRALGDMLYERVGFKALLSNIKNDPNDKDLSESVIVSYITNNISSNTLDPYVVTLSVELIKYWNECKAAGFFK